MKRLHICHLLLAFMLILPASPVAALQTLVVSDELLLKLGDAFSADGDYYRAITEYKKLLILFNDSPCADTALFRIGIAYYKGEEYESAVSAFSSLRTRYPKSRHVASAAYHEGLGLVKLKKPEKASEVFAVAAAVSKNAEEARSASFSKAIADFDRQDITASRLTLDNFIQQNPMDHSVVKAREAIGLLEQYQHLSYKSTVLAGAMSALIPGSGHVYAGHYGDGITSLLLNGLFIAGTVVAIDQKNYAVAGVTGLIGLPFYIGNIYGGVNAATKWNLGIRKELRGRLALVLEYPFQ